MYSSEHEGSGGMPPGKMYKINGLNMPPDVTSRTLLAFNVR